MHMSQENKYVCWDIYTNQCVLQLIVEDSVETRMMELQEKKRKLMVGAFGKKQSAEERRQTRINDLKSLMDL